MEVIKVIIIDDEERTCNRLESLLLNIEGIEIVGKYYDPEIAVNEIPDIEHKLIFIDVGMPRLSGFEVVKILNKKQTKSTFIFSTAYSQYAIKAIKASAFDYLLKPIDIDELNETINRYRVTDNTNLQAPRFYHSKLSDRENQIVNMVQNGLTSKEIAQKLYISKATVDTHRRNILDKTISKNFRELFLKNEANSRR